MEIANQEYFAELIRVTYTCAMASPDPSTQNGAFLVGYPETRSANEPTLGLSMEPSDWEERSTKLAYVEHAERNAIYKAASLGIRTQGLTMAASWAACPDCARAIVQAGISTLVRHVRPVHDSWLEGIQQGDRILAEACVNVIDIKGPVLRAAPVLHGGRVYYPSQDEYHG